MFTRIGLSLYAIALGAFFVGMGTEFEGALVTVVEIGLIGGSIVLAPAMLVTYMAKAAEREDTERGI